MKQLNSNGSPDQPKKSEAEISRALGNMIMQRAEA